MPRAAFRAALEDIVQETWTDARAIVWAHQAIRVPLDRLLEMTGGIPFCVLDYDLIAPAPGSGPANRIEQGNVWFYRVDDPDLDAGSASGGAETLEIHLEALRGVLAPHGADRGIFPAFQVRALPVMSVSLTLPLNQYWAGSQRPFILGAVIATVWTGEKAGP